MVITETRLTNLVGYIEYLLNYIVTQRKIAMETSDPNIKTTANNNALTKLDSIQTLINTVYSYLNRTKPVGTYTLQQLQSFGLF